MGRFVILLWYSNLPSICNDRATKECLDVNVAFKEVIFLLFIIGLELF